MKTRIALLAVLPLAFSLACKDANKVPAEAALQAAEAAVSSLGELGTKYVPEQTQELQKALADARELAAKKDYKGALAAAQVIPEKASAVLAAANAKQDEVLRKQELARAWSEISSAVPDLLSTLKSRLDILSLSKKLPAGLSKDILDQAKAGTAEIEAGFEAAKAKATAGEFELAVAKITEVRAKTAEVMKSIGMAQ